MRERELVQAADIVPDIEEGGIAAVVNGLALCAIHHLAFDRNLLGIDPGGVVHIAGRRLREIDGPMLKTGLQVSTAPRSRSRAGPTIGPIPLDSKRDSSAFSKRPPELRGVAAASARAPMAHPTPTRPSA